MIANGIGRPVINISMAFVEVAHFTSGKLVEAVNYNNNTNNNPYLQNMKTCRKTTIKNNGFAHK